MSKHDSSRRRFLKRSASAAGGGWILMSSAAVVAAFDLGCQNRAALQFAILSESQGAELEALTAMIIPSDGSPGAREAGVVWFIDAAVSKDPELADDLQLLLAGVREVMARQFPDRASFVELTPEERLAFMETIETSELFNRLRGATLTGMFAHPRHGGNRDKVGWQLLGFDDRHAWKPPFGHYDAAYTGAESPGQES